VARSFVFRFWKNLVPIADMATTVRNDDGILTDSKNWTCSETPLVPEQVLHFFGLKPYKNAFLKGSCSETEVSEQLHFLRFDFKGIP